MCHRLNEDGAHLFLKCKPVKELWKALNLDDLRRKLLLCADSKEVVGEILKQKEMPKLKSVALLSVWWRVRNKCNAGEAPATHEPVVFQIMSLTSELIGHCSKANVRLVQEPTCSWQNPSGDTLKINTDGSFTAASRSGGWGFVIRGASGDVLGAGAGHMHHAQDALHAEAEACLRALVQAQTWGMSSVQIETDSKLLVQAISGNNQDLALNGALFKEIKYQARLNFVSFSISYCPRACNKVADAMALYGAKLERAPPAFWLGSAPSFACDLVTSDLAGLSG
jgi:ribonuclease HI